MGTVDQRANEVGRRQHGRATRRQLRDAGVSSSTIARRIAAGTWVEAVPNVIDLRTHEPSWRGSVTEVVLAAGTEAWASHATAAHLLGFLDAPRQQRIDVLVPRTRHRRVGPHRLRSTRSIGVDEVTARFQIPCTTVPRTLVDLAGSTSPDELERWLADLTRRDADLPGRVVDLLDRHRHLPGRRRLHEVVARLPGDAWRLGSPLEVAGVQRLVALDAPPFVLQHVVHDHEGARVKRVDVAWPERRTILEFDGAAYHDLLRSRVDDAAVRERLRGLGWHVEVVRRRDLHGPALAGLVARLRAGTSVALGNASGARVRR